MNFRSTLALLALSSGLACNQGADASATPAGKAAGGERQGGTPGGPGGGGGGGRAPTSITLGPTDVATIGRGPFEQSIQITGDLRPIETVDVRARLDGELQSVVVREGDRVSAGQLLARFEPSEQVGQQKSAEADRASSQADLNTAQWNYEQSQELFKAGAIAERDLKASEQAVLSARARLAAAQSRFMSASKSTSETRVESPTAGVVATRQAEPGEHVARGAVLFTVVRTSTLELAAAVPAKSSSAIRVGQTVHFTADGRAFDGRVARVSPVIDPASRSVTVYIQVPNPGDALKGGTFATGRVVRRSAAAALVVPNAAVRQVTGSSGSMVYVVANETIEPTPVELGDVDEARGVSEVLSGLKEGDRVVVGNVGMLGRGMKVNFLQVEGAARREAGGEVRRDSGAVKPGR